ncbi:hypothetical protein LEP1GSC193_4066 [Leptospira alstonii serovar Pingchang str. 80-412]|uniref:Uncharacterized protein n=2 Tax=Leptospira alstonii TaxID=28452 RepID=M6CF65_9LEPT|nr:hypothetical protein LEP1GSC194_1164 [Leptospira alstonii serovar Sichuan str. 79601]EQA80497.1 hypothetical protein LEP1GSC193_4066 [Leptospira alstonii serovar Pingchang str. 80-412]
MLKSSIFVASQAQESESFKTFRTAASFLRFLHAQNLRIDLFRMGFEFFKVAFAFVIPNSHQKKSELSIF